jgi:S-disulfanyl-L-cysteine oxidoreductase SoxD
MSSCRRDLIAAAALAAAAFAAHAAPAAPFPGIGRSATPAEIAAWDIDVRPDFKGLPKGSGSVAQGMAVWEGRCASCHGVFGEANEVFSPLVGGTTAEDVKTGRVARLLDPSFPGRTTLMKVSTVSTLWDYIRRAMPWNAPKSLTVDEVYAVTAYLLNLGGVLPESFVLSDANIAQVQGMLPNRNGMTTAHAMWPGRLAGSAARPDVQAVACMSGCAVDPVVASILPDHARNSHGNLADQNRLVGAQHGASTGLSKGVAPAAAGAAATASLTSAHACTACHAQDNKIVGPAFRDIAKKYAGRSDAPQYLARKIQSGGSGVWGDVPMPPQTLPAEDAQRLAQWLADGAKR